MAILQTPLVWNPDDSSGWNQHPVSGMILEDSVDATYIWTDLNNSPKNARCFTPYYFADLTPTVPPDSAIPISVVIRYRTLKNAAATTITPIARLGAIQATYTPYALDAAYTDHDITFATDPNGAAWTTPNLKNTVFGLRSTIVSNGKCRWTKAELIYSYSTSGAIVPVATGVADLGGTYATLRGSIDPAGANAGNAVTLHFQYELASGNFTTPTTVDANPLSATGALVINIGADITGLTAGLLYHFRVKATQSAVDTYSNTINFTAAIGGNRFTMTRFARMPGSDYLLAKGRTRRNSSRFDLASTVDICPDLDFTPDDPENP